MSSRAASPLLSLKPLPAASLPPHYLLRDPSESGSAVQRPSLVSFVNSLLSEGLTFSQIFNSPSTFRKTGTKSASPSTSSVDILTHTVPETKDFWAARRSYHVDQKAPGTAEWDEFVFGLKDDHSKHEMDFTPTLYDAYHVLDWGKEVKELEAQGRIPGFSAVTMGIYEMCHELQFPLKARCFPVLVVTANVLMDTTEGRIEDGFIAVTIPVSLSAETTPTSFYASARNVTEGDTKQKRSKVVIGAYAAVERVKKVKSAPSINNGQQHPETTTKEGQIEWIMATTSDAKGNVPLAVQKLGVQGVVAKDVAYFIKWIRDVNKV